MTGTRRDSVKRKPIIGLTCSIDTDKDHQYKDTNYCEVISKAGGIPVLIPVFSDFSQDISQVMDQMDGIIITGGHDVDPIHYGEEPIKTIGPIHPDRDDVEIQIVKECIDQKKPFFGICRGAQILNIALGGDLYQDIYTQIRGKELERHHQWENTSVSSHSIEIQSDSFLYDIFKQKIGWVNSSHHQAIRKVAPSLKPVAWSKDGIVEAVVHKTIPSIFAVQWHPEKMWREDSFAQQIFQYFVGVL